MVAQALKPSDFGGRDRQISSSLRPVWFLGQILGHPGQHRETLSQTKQNKTEVKK